MIAREMPKPIKVFGFYTVASRVTRMEHMYITFLFSHFLTYVQCDVTYLLPSSILTSAHVEINTLNVGAQRFRR